MLGPERQQGIALVIVLWALTILGVLIASQMYSTRADLRATKVEIEAGQAQTLADAGVYRGVDALLSADPSLSKPVGRLTFALGGGTIHVQVEAEQGKVDLNTVDPSVFEILLRSVGVNELLTRDISAALLDYRDADHLRRPNGAEDTDYVQAGLPYDAKDAPLDAIEELQQVMGMTPTLYRRIAPAVTVYGRRRSPVLAVAGVIVRNAFGISADLKVPGLTINDDGTKIGIFTIRSQARYGQALAGIVAVVSITRNPQVPYAILSWQDHFGA